MADRDELPDIVSAKAWVKADRAKHGLKHDPKGQEHRDELVEDREGELGPPERGPEETDE